MNVNYIVVPRWELGAMRHVRGPAYIWMAPYDKVVEVYNDLAMGDMPAGNLAKDVATLRNYMALGLN